MNHRILLAIAALAALFVARTTTADTIKVLIIDGQNNHNWDRTTPYMQSFLKATGKFSVDTTTTPPKGAAGSDWDAWRPKFADYDVLLSNYNGETWPEPVRDDFEAFVKSGGGVMNVHAANNPFPDWPEWNKMTGICWRRADFGPRLALDDEGNEVRMEPGEGKGAGHGPRYPYPVIVRDRKHPVTEGMPLEWLHPADELYHGQRGPALNMHILATAYSAKHKRGTGYHEPMVWWIPYGEGRVFTTVLGHVGKTQPLEDSPMRCLGFQAIVTRGTEWAATGKVTIPLPERFPTDSGVSLAN